MSLDPTVIGRETGRESLLFTRSRLQFFAKATGQTDPVYTDVEVAQQAGHRDLPVPPTLFTAITMESPEPFAWLDELGVDLRSILHGEQEFIYHAMAYAGDELTAVTTLTDAYEKKGGALTFIVSTTAVTNQLGEAVLDAISTTVARAPEGA